MLRILLATAMALALTGFLPSRKAIEPSTSLREWEPFLVDVGGTGSGLVVNSSPIVVMTAAHVVSEYQGRKIELRSPIFKTQLGYDSVLTSRVMYSQRSDVAFLLVEQNLGADIPGQIADSNAAFEAGRRPVTALKLSPSMRPSVRRLDLESGVISMRNEVDVRLGVMLPYDREVLVCGIGPNIWAGDSGAPVFDDLGRVIGTVSAFVALSDRDPTRRLNLAASIPLPIPTHEVDFGVIGEAVGNPMVVSPPVFPTSEGGFKVATDPNLSQDFSFCIDEFRRRATEVVAGKKKLRSKDLPSECVSLFEVFRTSIQEVFKAESIRNEAVAIKSTSREIAKRVPPNQLAAAGDVYCTEFGRKTSCSSPPEVEALLQSPHEICDGECAAAVTRVKKFSAQERTALFGWVGIPEEQVQREIGENLVLQHIDGETSATQNLRRGLQEVMRARESVGRQLLEHAELVVSR